MSHSVVGVLDTNTCRAKYEFNSYGVLSLISHKQKSWRWNMYRYLPPSLSVLRKPRMRLKDQLRWMLNFPSTVLGTSTLMSSFVTARNISSSLKFSQIVVKPNLNPSFENLGITLGDIICHFSSLSWVICITWRILTNHLQAKMFGGLWGWV